MDTAELFRCLVIALSVAIAVQTIGIVWFWLKKKKDNTLAGEQIAPEQLAKTKEQLWREIERHQATEDLLRKTQRYIHSVVNSIDSVLIGVTRDGYVTHWNRAAAETSGLSAEMVMGAKVTDVFPNLPVSIGTVATCIDTGEPFRQENVSVGEAAEERYLDIKVYPLKELDSSSPSPQNRALAGAVLLLEDVTSRVRVEKMMVQNEKLMSLGELAAGLAHEINNPLAVILNNVQNIERRVSPTLPANQEKALQANIDLNALDTYCRSRDIFQLLGDIRDAGTRAADIVKSMLEFSRTTNQKAATDLNKLLTHSLQLAQNTFKLETPAGIELPDIHCDLEENLPLIYAAATEIQQVILNLLLNAAQAFRSEEYGAPLQPQIHIQTKRCGGWVVITVEDNGPGMPDNVKRQIFNPFFTTKEVGKGTGLGLSVSYFIIKEHHQGEIDVESVPGEGTRFTIRLPLAS
ncbi:ATP-binding protein [Saccharophagus degradans]|uniref:two-component system sensor histidine kinase NtrB n=1 Tax=Saccharophagus degradans TaxID=86304 RepID=UPI0024781FD6|nr:ATP-binding protein [Saccharophagus degradans]WGO96772.1 ATP-binding protein [Saccharophagus degradans]